jgi:hypothetical protein
VKIVVCQCKPLDTLICCHQNEKQFVGSKQLK